MPAHHCSPLGGSDADAAPPRAARCRLPLSAALSLAQVLAWDTAQQQGRPQLGSFPPPAPDGLHPPFDWGGAAVAGLDAVVEQGRLRLAAGHSDGSLSLVVE